MSKKTTKSPKDNTETPEDKMKARFESLKRSHEKIKLTRRPLYRAIISALPSLTMTDDLGDNDAIATAWEQFFKVVYGWKQKAAGSKKTVLTGGMGESTRNWFISKHWLFEVCNPAYDKENPKYSPYRKNLEWNQVQLSNDFGELQKLEPDEQNDKLIRHGDKLLPNADAVSGGYFNFGSAWDQSGHIILTDASGVRPVLDGWSKHVKELVDAYVKKHSGSKYRPMRALLAFHTHDHEENSRDGVLDHTEVHAHIDLESPEKQTRLQIMKVFGFDINFWTETFKWAGKQDDALDRVTSLLGQLISEMKNVEKINDKARTRKYLVHQSVDAVNKEKAVYRTGEVFTWFPDEKTNYEQFANVYDDTPANMGHDAIIRNLHSPLNLANNAVEMVGRNKEDNKRFTMKMVEAIRNCRGDDMKLLLTFMRLVDRDLVDISDFKDLLRCAFDEDDYNTMVSTHLDLMNAYRNAKADYIHSVKKNFKVDRETIIFTSKMGGTGKTWLANCVAKCFDKGRRAAITSAKSHDKTFDPFESYDGERSIVMDEINGKSFDYGELKKILEGNVQVMAASRNNGVSLWNVHHLFITQKYENGVGDYIKDVMTNAHDAPGLEDGGYLEKVDGEWRVKPDKDSQDDFIGDYSQIIRRLKVAVDVERPTPKRTRVNVSILNFLTTQEPDMFGHQMQYVHTKDSVKTFNYALNALTSEEDTMKIAKWIHKTILKLQKQAREVYVDKGSDVFLDAVDSRFVVTPMGLEKLNTPATPQQPTIIKNTDELFDTTYSYDCEAGAEPSEYYQQYMDMKIKLTTKLLNSNGSSGSVSLSVAELFNLADYSEMLADHNDGGRVQLPNGKYTTVLAVLHDAYQLSRWVNDARLLTPVQELVDPVVIDEPDKPTKEQLAMLFND